MASSWMLPREWVDATTDATTRVSWTTSRPRCAIIPVWIYPMIAWASYWTTGWIDRYLQKMYWRLNDFSVINMKNGCQDWMLRFPRRFEIWLAVSKRMSAADMLVKFQKYWKIRKPDFASCRIPGILIHQPGCFPLWKEVSDDHILHNRF